MASNELPGTDMDFDVLARLRRLEADIDNLRDRIGQLERHSRHYLDAPEYKRKHDITEHEAMGAMLHTMRMRDDNEL